jgi:hypothetical protein
VLGIVGALVVLGLTGLFFVGKTVKHDLDRTNSLVLTDEDLPGWQKIASSSGWFVGRGARRTPDDVAAVERCIGGNQPLTGEVRAETMRAYSNATGQVTTSSADAFGSDDAAGRVMALLRTERAQRCLGEGIAHGLQQGAGALAGVENVHVAPMPAPAAGDESISLRWTMDLVVGGGRRVPVVSDLVAVRRGDLVVQLTFAAPGTGFDPGRAAMLTAVTTNRLGR